MASQSSKDIIAALVSTIEDIDDFKQVTSNVITEVEASTNMLPAAVIYEGPKRAGGFITKTSVTYMEVMVDIHGSADTSNDDLRELEESILDAVAGNVSLDDTCITCMYVSSTQPVMWPSSGFKSVQMFFDIQYWRDIS